MPDNVIPFPTSNSNLACPDCGSEWFDVKAINLDTDMHPIGYAAPVTCHECGRVVPARG